MDRIVGHKALVVLFICACIALAALPVRATALETETVYRLYNRCSGEHHYTTDSNEYSVLGHIGWVQEGVAWVSPKSSTPPVYRLYNPNNGDHH